MALGVAVLAALATRVARLAPSSWAARIFVCTTERFVCLLCSFPGRMYPQNESILGSLGLHQALGLGKLSGLSSFAHAGLFF